MSHAPELPTASSVEASPKAACPAGALALAAGSAVCQLCNLWEPERGYQPEMANMGFCPMFNKRTRFNHGSQCTAHSALHSSNNMVSCDGRSPGVGSSNWLDSVSFSSVSLNTKTT
jgi:hypothetical protein